MGDGFLNYYLTLTPLAERMDGQQYQLPGSAVLRKPSVMPAPQHPQQQPQQQQPVMMQQQQQQAQMMSLGQEAFAFESLEGQAIPSALLEQQTRAPEPFTGPSSQARGATMQEVFIQVSTWTLIWKYVFWC